MTDQGFEQRFAARLRSHADEGLAPYDAVEVARQAIHGRTRLVAAPRRGAPVWLRSLALAATLLVMLIAVAFAGGLIRLPAPIIEPSPSASLPIDSPSPSVTSDPSGSPLPTVDPSMSPSGSPTLSPSASPSASPSPTLSPSPSPSPSPTPTATASASPTPTPTPASGWREIAFPGNAQRVRVSDAAYRDGVSYVAVGDSNGQGRAWYSYDGQSWTRALDGGFAGRVVVATDDFFYAIGALGDETRVWRSPDGVEWSLLLASPEPLGFVNDLAYANGVLVAVGTTDDFDAPMVWQSADGMDWVSTVAPDAASELTRVALRGGDIAVIGDDFTGHGRKLFVRLTHTAGWQEHQPFGEDVDGRLLDLATNGGRFVAVGYEDDFNTGERLATVRSSVDGTSWTRSLIADGDRDRNHVFDQVVALPDGRFLAIGAVRQYSVGECVPDACVFLDETLRGWLSADGISWQPGRQIYDRTEDGPSEVGDDVGRQRAVVAGLAGIVILDRWADGLHVFRSPLAELQ